MQINHHNDQGNTFILTSLFRSEYICFINVGRFELLNDWIEIINSIIRLAHYFKIEFLIDHY